MFIPLSTCASNGDAFFFGRDRREEPLPVGCSLLDLREVAEDTGISVDDVISQLDDFSSADALLGFGISLAAAEAAEEVICTEKPVCGAAFAMENSFAVDVSSPFEGESAVFGAAVEPEPVFAKEAPMETVLSEEPAPVETVIEAETVVVVEERQESAPQEAAAVIETVIEAAPVSSEQEEGGSAPQAESSDFEAISAEMISAAWERRRATLREKAAKKEQEKASAAAVETTPAEQSGAETSRDSAGIPVKAANYPRLDLAKLRKMANVRVEAAEPEEDSEDDHLIDLNVPDGYVVQTSTESVVWPWEVRSGMTLKEALEALSDSLLASLTEEVVNCTISGQMGEGGIKSLCDYYQKEMEQIYSAIQKESRRRITRMSARAPQPSAMASDATQEMAMRMAKQFLQNEMGKKAMRFKSPFPDENGIYHIFQSHRVEDEDSVDFPNERVFYRELGGGWAISVGY